MSTPAPRRTGDVSEVRTKGPSPVRDGDRPDPASVADRIVAEQVRLPRQVVSGVAFFMAEEKISQAELGRRLGLSPGRISQILSGGENFTLRTLASVIGALGAECEFSLARASPAG